MKGKKYYAVIADNGFMVSNSWEYVLKMRLYFRGDNAVGFRSREDAIMAARTEFNERHEHVKYYGEVIVNKPYFSKDIGSPPISTSMVEFYN
jgi:hypothetical protein